MEGKDYIAFVAALAMVAGPLTAGARQGFKDGVKSDTPVVSSDTVAPKPAPASVSPPIPSASKVPGSPSDVPANSTPPSASTEPSPPPAGSK